MSLEDRPGFNLPKAAWLLIGPSNLARYFLLIWLQFILHDVLLVCKRCTLMLPGFRSLSELDLSTKMQ